MDFPHFLSFLSHITDIYLQVKQPLKKKEKLNIFLLRPLFFLKGGCKFWNKLQGPHQGTESPFSCSSRIFHKGERGEREPLLPVSGAPEEEVLLKEKK